MLEKHSKRPRLSASSAAKSASKPVIPKSSPEAQRRAIWLVVFCTFLGAGAQILMKMGADYTKTHPGIAGMITNPVLIAGYALYAVVTILIVVAYKDGELSVLYPLISLSYVWVAVLSVFIFHDTLNAYKLIGVAVIICGVAVIGRGTKQ
jgi:drug/metabolite transporter (DMT)-like permease